MRPERKTGRSRLLVCALLVGAGLMSLAGCQKSLFPSGQPRTQFDRYDAARNQYANQTSVDEFGRRRPNLRGRLLPRE